MFFQKIIRDFWGKKKFLELWLKYNQLLFKRLAFHVRQENPAGVRIIRCGIVIVNRVGNPGIIHFNKNLDNVPLFLFGNSGNQTLVYFANIPYFHNDRRLPNRKFSPNALFLSR